MNTYKDVFVEELVVRQTPITVTLLKLGMLIMAVVLSVVFRYLAVTLLGNFAGAVYPALFLLTWAAVFVIWRMLGKEFEYSFYSGDVDVEKIIGKRRRSNVLSFSCSRVTVMAPYSEKYDSQIKSARMIDARGSGAGERDWVVLINPENGEETALIFSPSDRMLDAFRQYVRGGRFKED